MKRILLIIIIFISIQNVHGGQIKSLPNNMYILIGNNVNLRTKPALESKSIHLLKAANKVKVLKRSGVKTRIGDMTGEWVFVDTGLYKLNSDEKIKGWLFDYFIADFKDFQPVESFYNVLLKGYVGDWNLWYQFNKNGTYKRKIIRESGEIVYFTGKLYKYNNVYCAYVEKYGDGDFFYLTDEGYLCYVESNYDGKQNCVKVK